MRREASTSAERHSISLPDGAQSQMQQFGGSLISEMQEQSYRSQSIEEEFAQLRNLGYTTNQRQSQLVKYTDELLTKQRLLNCDRI
jgi:hypothetical protein